MTELVTVTWQDVNLVPAKTHFKVEDGVDPRPILDALQAHSGAALIEWAIGTVHVVSATPSGALLSSVNDLAGLRFCAATGGCTVLTLPAPDLGLFFGGASEVDPSLITDVIAACLGNLTDSGGHIVTRYDTGYRTSVRRGDF